MKLNNNWSIRENKNGCTLIYKEPAVKTELGNYYYQEEYTTDTKQEAIDLFLGKLLIL